MMLLRKKIFLGGLCLFFLLGHRASAGSDEMLISLRNELKAQESKLKEIQEKLQQAKEKLSKAQRNLIEVRQKNSEITTRNQQTAQRIAKVKTQLEQISTDLKDKEREVRKKACVAQRERIKAQIERQKAMCYARWASFRECQARKAAGQLKGAVVGVLLATVTGGSSLLLTGAGAVAGGMGKSNHCESPTCRNIQSEYLHILNALPDCDQLEEKPVRLFAPPPRLSFFGQSTP